MFGSGLVHGPQTPGGILEGLMRLISGVRTRSVPLTSCAVSERGELGNVVTGAPPAAPERSPQPGHGVRSARSENAAGNPITAVARRVGYLVICHSVDNER